MATVIAKCGHEVKVAESDEGEFLDVPDACAMCEELAEVGRDINYDPNEESCPVCGSIYHIHCSRGCAICDDPKNPQPRFASRFCPGCKRSLCQQCFEDHTCQ